MSGPIFRKMSFINMADGGGIFALLFYICDVLCRADTYAEFIHS